MNFSFFFYRVLDLNYFRPKSVLELRNSDQMKLRITMKREPKVISYSKVCFTYKQFQCSVPHRKHFNVKDLYVEGALVTSILFV